MKSGFGRGEDGEMPSLMESDASDGSRDQLPAPPSRPRLVPPRPPEMSTSYQELRASYQYDDDDCSEYSVSDGGDSLSEDSMDRARPSQRRERGQAGHRPDAPDCTDNGRDPVLGGRQKSSSRRRRSVLSRRFSLEGTTIYASPHMADLDRLLRSDYSGLRLKTNGTCSFLYEGTRFSVETSQDTPGEYLLYSSLGTLREIQARNRKNVLKLMALWNEDLQTRARVDMSRRSSVDSETLDSADDGGEPAMLRIDSSKGDGNNPHVAFIYYGRLDSIEDTDHFREILDDFVDDALEFGDRLDGSVGGRHDGDSGNRLRDGVGRSSRDPPENDARFRDSRSRDGNSESIPSLDPLDEQDALSDREKTPDHHPDAKPDQPKYDTNAPASHKMGSVFSKIKRGFKGRRDDIGSKAFIDPSNSQCAFVVDKATVKNEGGVSVRLNLSKSAASFNDSHGSKGFGNSARGKSLNRSEPLIHASSGNRREGSFHGSSGRRSSSNHDDDHHYHGHHGGHRSGSRHARLPQRRPALLQRSIAVQVQVVSQPVVVAPRIGNERVVPSPSRELEELPPRTTTVIAGPLSHVRPRLQLQPKHRHLRRQGLPPRRRGRKEARE
ncbi:hypothetical protein THAOC_06550 [Thalassiosira oceanica]|uniref:Uncharacterized protein n=1 Tax=Thalassiosira oceanica TaxID=159749 RepID=K0SZZ3_THAOC|nr:hypothetical protein THAOC_06550 [Thalassiosira oceanica]|eukprot:EJK71958.1 hypothetical protein THAOC_06550 [Thalassiosira oceanica]